jgi:hypothetical protein
MTVQSNKLTLDLAAGLIALPLSLTACVADDEAVDEEEFRDHSGGWDPFPVDENMCEEGEISRPPTGGQCEIELYLKRTTYVDGQGASESRAEMSTVVTAISVDAQGNPVFVDAVVPEMKYNPGESKGHNISLGTYTVQTGDIENVWLCGEFTEHDSGGINGQDDVGSICTKVVLECDPVEGQPTLSRVVGPAQLCGPNQCNGSASATVQVMRADADMDNVPNPVDVTPEPCDEVNKGTEGIALLLYVHYDDPTFVSLAQTIGTNYSAHYAEYDYVALVMDNGVSNEGNLEAAAFQQADVVFEPSREGLLDAFRDLTSKGYRFDVKTHAHGYPNGAYDSEIEVVTGDPISGDWLITATDPDEIGTARGGIPIIALWGTSCFQSLQIDAWHTVGALVASGAHHINFVPNAWMNYWDAWVTGVQYQPAVDSSVTLGVLAATQSFIVAQGAAPPYMCVAPTVLGQNACAEDFFNDDVGPNDAAYNLEDIYNHSLSGAQNMAIASQRTFIGDVTTTFGGGAADWP